MKNLVLLVVMMIIANLSHAGETFLKINSFGHNFEYSTYPETHSPLWEVEFKGNKVTGDIDHVAQFRVEYPKYIPIFSNIKENLYINNFFFDSYFKELNVDFMATISFIETFYANEIPTDEFSAKSFNFLEPFENFSLDDVVYGDVLVIEFVMIDKSQKREEIVTASIYLQYSDALSKDFTQYLDITKKSLIKNHQNYLFEKEQAKQKLIENQEAIDKELVDPFFQPKEEKKGWFDWF